MNNKNNQHNQHPQDSNGSKLLHYVAGKYVSASEKRIVTNKQKEITSTINKIRKEPLTLFLDVDDTVTKSAQAVVEILNKRYNITPPKTVADITDWGFKSIVPGISGEEVVGIFESDELFDNLKMYEEFEQFCDDHKYDNMFNYVFVTKGEDVNLQKKRFYICDQMLRLGIDADKFEYIGLYRHDENGNTSYDKSSVDMSHSIQIDDRIDCLKDTNAAVKILITNDRYGPWNDTKNYEPISNMYVVDNWDEARQIIEYFASKDTPIEFRI